MPDNIRITTPVPSNEGINRVPSSKQTAPLQGVDLLKAAQPNTESPGNRNGEFEFLLNRNSVFSTFIEQLKQTPGLAQNMQKIAFDLFGMTESAGGGRAVSAFMNGFAEAMRMEKADILANLLFQGSSQTKFSDPVFGMFREIAARSPNHETNRRLAEFLKAYDNFFSIGSTTTAILKELNAMQQQIPTPYSGQLQALTEELIPPRTDGEVPPQEDGKPAPQQPAGEASPWQQDASLSANLKVLKGKIIPFLAKYVTSSNDFGRVRSNITLLVHDIARLNVSSHEELTDKFHALLDYCRFDLNYPAAKTEEMKSVFLGYLNRSPQKSENALLQSLLQILSEGSRQSTSSLSQSLFREAVSSLLMDNSVYMPFRHLFLPVNYNGHFMFSEIWIEKDDVSKQGRIIPAGEKTTRMYLTFDIKSLGYFEATVELAQKKALVRINCPPELAADVAEISQSVSKIFSRNGLSAEHVDVVPDNTPSVPRKIMKKVYERKSAIDVTV